MQRIKYFVNHLFVKSKYNIIIVANSIENETIYQVCDHIGQKIEDIKKKREQSIGEDKHPTTYWSVCRDTDGGNIEFYEKPGVVQ